METFKYPLGRIKRLSHGHRSLHYCKISELPACYHIVQRKIEVTRKLLFPINEMKLRMVNP